MAEDISVKRRRQRPVTRHPLFPTVVTLWAAALFGVISFVVPTWRLESLSMASGIAAVLPAAAPPLGGTARVLFALLCAAAGGAIGAAIGRKLANRSMPAGASPDAATAPEWPLTALADAGATPFGPTSDAVDTPILDPAPLVPTAAQRIAAASLDGLSHVELVERLAIALEHRRQHGSLSRAQAEVLQRSYGTLQALVHARGHTDAGDESPVVNVGELAAQRDSHGPVHTGSSGQDPETTERALRHALASLQQMSRHA